MDAAEEDVLDKNGLRASLEEKSGGSLMESQSSPWDCQDQGAKIINEAPGSGDCMVQAIDGQSRLRYSLLLAALACVLRPTNILIWICVSCFAFIRMMTKGKVLPLPWEGAQIWVHMTSLSLGPARREERRALFRETTLCGQANYQSCRESSLTDDCQ